MNSGRKVNKVGRSLAFILLVLCFGLSVQTAVAQKTTKQVVGPRAVWSSSEGKWEDISDQCSKRGKTDINCIGSMMRKAEASPEAVAFAKLMKGEFYLSAFKETGTVDVAEMTGPVINDPNTTESILVNGSPPIVKLWEHTKNINIKKDRNYRKITRRFPEAMLWPTHTFKTLKTKPDGGQRFIFSFVLLNGCRGCEVAGSAEIAFDFDKQGRFQVSRLLGLTQVNN